MNSGRNNDSEQCPESILGWVHQVHTLNQPVRTGCEHCAQVAHTACARHRVAGPTPAVSQAWLAVSCIVSPHPRACRVAAPALCREPVSRYNPAAKQCTVSRPTGPPPQREYNLYRDSTWPGHARARTGRPYRGPLMVVSWRRLGRVVAESWPCLGPWLRSLAIPCATEPCCVTIQSVVL